MIQLCTLPSYESESRYSKSAKKTTKKSTFSTSTLSTHGQFLVVFEFWKDTFVEHQHNGIVLCDRSAEDSFQEPVCAHRFSDVSSETELCYKFGRLEPPHILRVVEEVFHDSKTLSHSDWQPREYYLFENYAIGVNTHESSRGHKHHLAVVKLLEDQQWTRQESDRRVRSSHAKSIVLMKRKKE